MQLTGSEWRVLAFTCAYIVGFSIYFLSTSNREFLWYIVTMIGLMALLIAVARVTRMPPALLWALSLWGLAHMAGGGVPWQGGVLYGWQILPLVSAGELILLKYDQVVHAYGFGVAAWLLWIVLHRHFPALRGTRAIVIFAALGSMGLGTVNEIVEFAAVVALPSTNVGGYFNTALDLVFNAVGAGVAAAIMAVGGGRRGGRSGDRAGAR